MSRAVAAVIAVAAGGCADDGAALSSTIAAPRLLAVAADPPVVGRGGAAMIEALVVDDDGDRLDAAAAQLAIRACSPWTAIQDPARDCGSDASLPLALDGDVARLEVDAVLARFPPPPELPTGGGGEGDDPCPLAYQHVDLPIVVEAAAVDGAGDLVRLTGRKRLRLTWTPDVVRTNPRVEAMLIDGTEVTAVPAGAEVTLTVRPAMSSLDRACDAGDPPDLVLEPVRINVYTTAGELAAESVDATYDADDVESLAGTTYLTPTDGVAALWAVAIDGDGGVGWARFDLTARGSSGS